jgi:hypothetical protein
MGKGGKEMNYEKNFRDDYQYIVNRYNELCEVVDNYDTTDIRPNCPKDMLEMQLDAMFNLIKIMETRADTEGITL